jgi:pyridoxal phosphate enzyme (YggS family)
LPFRTIAEKIMSQRTQGIADLARRFQTVRRSIEVAAERCNRSPDGITLVAVTKTHPAQTVQHALSVGLKDFGENRVQEAEDKIVELGRDAARWHLVGHLQANKARRAVRLFDVIHSVDSAALAQRLDWLCADEDRTVLQVFLQVDLAKEETKSGVDVIDLDELAQSVSGCKHLQLAGLMTVPPFFPESEGVRPFFKRLRELRDELQSRGFFGERLGELSMGMSHDFEIAIEEGSTIVRIGTALFGEREATQ